MASYPPPSDSYAKKTDDMASVSSTPAVQGVDHNGIVVGRWKSGIFDCLESLVPNACMSMLCPGVTIAQICARLGMCNYYYVLGGFLVLYLLALIAAASGSEFMNALVVLLSLFTAVFVGRLRWRVRFLFSLPGSAVEDCIYATFCGCCAIAQMATQVESYTPGSCSIMPRNTLEGYTFA